MEQFKEAHKGSEEIKDSGMSASEIKKVKNFVFISGLSFVMEMNFNFSDHRSSFDGL